MFDIFAGIFECTKYLMEWSFTFIDVPLILFRKVERKIPVSQSARAHAMLAYQWERMFSCVNVLKARRGKIINACFKPAVVEKKISARLQKAKTKKRLDQVQFVVKHIHRIYLLNSCKSFINSCKLFITSRIKAHENYFT